MISFRIWNSLCRSFSANVTDIWKNMANVVQLGGNPDCLGGAVALAANSLMSGNIISVPTDTIYGLAALAQSAEAVEKLYEVKGRNGNKPIAICVSCIEDIHRWGYVTVSDDILRDLLPGPVTVVFRRRTELNPDFNPSSELIGLRIPKYPFIQQLAAAVGEPIALTSANPSAQRSTLAVKEFEDLWSKIDLVFDGGVLSDSEESRQGSTVIDLSVMGRFSIIRPGSAEEKTIKILNGKYHLKEKKR
ncbi:yrdC domain-containing protein, mitochondrial-like [Lytechinus variegatus]|uniref:yrdC domain-containing protein, mitochondrial-like n=1 Tax=Lytechinus variegatus TaxID=7654 RepID=UPI001BB282E3|nr:yrdC domain-containing protein, mitochondrial-like [Lytechinus variegatus]